MVPRLIVNAVRHGRALDILATHAPAWNLQDQEDPAHRGFQAFRWLLKVFKPRYHFHGHIHVYSKETPVLTRFHDTLVINTYGYRETNLHLHPLQRPSRAETPAI
jgi:Icc-related predicted phosphoesterase